MSSTNDQQLAQAIEQFHSAAGFEDRYRALLAVIRLATADQCVAVLRRGLDDADSVVRAGAARWLGMQAAASPRPGSNDDWTGIAARWQDLLTDADPDVRFESARGLVQLDPADLAAATGLAEFLHDLETPPPMLAATLKTFTQIRPHPSITAPPWSRFLLQEHAGVREAAAQALATWGAGSAELAGELLPLLDDEEPFVREEAARTLGVLGVTTPEILLALESAAQDEDEVAAQAARASLSRLRG